MSKERQLQKAKHEYKQFLRELWAFPARTTTIDDTEPPVKEPLHVPRADAVKVFLAKSPEYSEFREELLKVYEEVGELPLSAKDWRDVSGET